MGSLPVEVVVGNDLKVGASATGTRTLALPLAFALGLAVRTLTPLDNSSAVTGLGGTEVALRFTWLPRPAPRTAKE